MSACACMGPPGDCPCIRQARGLPVPITETFVSKAIWDCIPDADKEKINKIKQEAFFAWFVKNQNIPTEDQT